MTIFAPGRGVTDVEVTRLRLRVRADRLLEPVRVPGLRRLACRLRGHAWTRVPGGRNFRACRRCGACGWLT